MIEFEYFQASGLEVIYRFFTSSKQSGLVAFNRMNGNWRFIKKVDKIPDVYIPMFATAASKVKSAKEILKKMSVVCY